MPNPLSFSAASVPELSASFGGLTPSLGAEWRSGCLSLKQGSYGWVVVASSPAAM